MVPGSTFCDIGSGVGAISLKLAKTHSHLRLTLQDQPQILEHAQDVRIVNHFYSSMTVVESFRFQVWRHEFPEALAEQRVDFVPLDFFKEGPAKNHDIYYVTFFLFFWKIMNFRITIICA
jgi:hypothetical protein